MSMVELHNQKHEIGWVGIAGILAMALAFATMTYNPPHHFLFKCPQTQEYGIPAEKRESPM
jgi:hypothetical protein